MILAAAIEMDRPGEQRVRLELVELLFQQQRVGAEIDVFAARHQGFDNLDDFFMQQRLAAGDRDDRRAALFGRLNAFLDRQARVQDVVGIVDLAAAGAGQVAAEERLQHQHKRVALVTDEVLAGDIGAYANGLGKGNAHGFEMACDAGICKAVI